ncbi:MAG: hypothetical protein WC291_07250 [Thermodesulfovibrionales bacterium]
MEKRRGFMEAVENEVVKSLPINCLPITQPALPPLTTTEHIRRHALQSATSRLFLLAQVTLILDLLNEGRVQEAVKRLKLTAEAV